MTRRGVTTFWFWACTIAAFSNALIVLSHASVGNFAWANLLVVILNVVAMKLMHNTLNDIAERNHK